MGLIYNLVIESFLNRGNFILVTPNWYFIAFMTLFGLV